jgi:hypothetical protein
MNKSRTPKPPINRYANGSSNLYKSTLHHNAQVADIPVTNAKKRSEALKLADQHGSASSFLMFFNNFWSRMLPHKKRLQCCGVRHFS